MSVQQALERRRRQAAIKSVSIYLHRAKAEEVQHVRDMAELSDELLRLTDPTPIDEAWLRKIGQAVGYEGDRGRWVCRIVSKTRNGYERPVATVVLRSFETLLCDYDGDYIEIPTVTTRGELRMLAAVLRIEINEKGEA